MRWYLILAFMLMTSCSSYKGVIFYVESYKGPDVSRQEMLSEISADDEVIGYFDRKNGGVYLAVPRGARNPVFSSKLRYQIISISNVPKPMAGILLCQTKKCSRNEIAKCKFSGLVLGGILPGDDLIFLKKLRSLYYPVVSISMSNSNNISEMILYYYSDCDSISEDYYKLLSH
jgi:hypothetical protein